MLAGSGVNWTTVLLALIAALPGLLAAFYARNVHAAVKTPSGTSIGSQVEDALHVALANNMHIRSVGEKVAAVAPDGAAGEEALVPKLAEVEAAHPPPPPPEPGAPQPPA